MQQPIHSGNCTSAIGRAMPAVNSPCADLKEGVSPPLDPSCCLFFARAPPDMPGEQLLELFSRYGTVKDINLYRRWPTAKASKGCGTVQFADKESAAAALQALNGNHKFPGSDAVLVVERLDLARQNKQPKQSAPKDIGSVGTKDQYRRFSYDGSCLSAMDAPWSSPLTGALDTNALQSMLALMSFEMLSLGAQAAGNSNTTQLPSVPQRTTWSGAPNYGGGSFSQPGNTPYWSMNHSNGFPARSRRSSCPDPSTASLGAAARSLRSTRGSFDMSGHMGMLTPSQLLLLQQQQQDQAMLLQVPQQTQIPSTSVLAGDLAWAGRSAGHYGSLSDGSFAAQTVQGALGSTAASATSLYASQSQAMSALAAACNACSMQTLQPGGGVNAHSDNMFSPPALPLAEPTCNLDWLRMQQEEAQLAAAAAAGTVSSTAAAAAAGAAIRNCSSVAPEPCMQLANATMGPNSSTTAAAAAAGGAPSAASNGLQQQQQQQQQQQELVVGITPEVLGTIGGTLTHIAGLSRAKIQVRPYPGGLALAITGNAAERDIASRLICHMMEQPQQKMTGLVGM